MRLFDSIVEKMLACSIAILLLAVAFSIIYITVTGYGPCPR